MILYPDNGWKGQVSLYIQKREGHGSVAKAVLFPSYLPLSAFVWRREDKDTSAANTCWLVADRFELIGLENSQLVAGVFRI